VDDLSFNVARSETLGLLGPNGSGKTTTLLCLAGLLRPDAGTISYDGAVLGADRAGTVALIPETPEVYPMLTAWEHLIFVAKSCRLDQGWSARAKELMERFDLGDHADTLGAAMSKGMRQKTLIAATVLAGSPVLLLDEPLIGLDPKGQRELRNILAEQRHDGRAIIVSTHLLESAEVMCDSVLIIKDGHALARGPVAQLRDCAQTGRSLEDVFLEVTG